jgi:hypothetical protein
MLDKQKYQLNNIMLQDLGYFVNSSNKLARTHSHTNTFF